MHRFMWNGLHAPSTERRRRHRIAMWAGLLSKAGDLIGDHHPFTWREYIEIALEKINEPTNRPVWVRRDALLSLPELLFKFLLDITSGRSHRALRHVLRSRGLHIP